MTRRLARALATNPAWRFVPYATSAPTIATLTPSSGAENTEVAIAGSGFASLRRLTFGGIEPEFWRIDSDSQITARVPAGVGTVDVVVQTSGGTATLAGGFTYGALPAPSISALNYYQGQPEGGGKPIVIIGSGFTDATVVDFGGSSATFVVDSDTKITAALPAHAAGSVSVTVTGPGGTSAAASFEYWSPAQLTLTGWWRADSTTGYALAAGTGTFLAKASAGTSGAAGNLTEGTNPPAVGAALEGHAPPDFDGTNDVLQSSTDWGSLVSGTDGTVLVLFNADTAAAPATAAYDDRPLVCDDNFGFNLGFSSGGVCPAFYDGGWKPAAPSRVACSTGAWHLAKCRWSGGTLGWGVDSGAMTTTAVGALQTFAGCKLTLGRVQISSTLRFDGRIAELITSSSAIADADITKVRNYCAQRYGESV